jgi:hypothetical protein
MLPEKLPQMKVSDLAWWRALTGNNNLPKASGCVVDIGFGRRRSLVVMRTHTIIDELVERTCPCGWSASRVAPPTWSGTPAGGGVAGVCGGRLHRSVTNHDE